MLALPQLKQIDATWVYSYTLYVIKDFDLNLSLLGMRDKYEIWTTAQATNPHPPTSLLVQLLLKKSACTVIIFFYKATTT